MIDTVLRRLGLAAIGAPPVQAGAPGDIWGPKRAPPKDQDRVLLSETHLWLRRIPPRVHPKHLCRYHPRLANRVASCWGDRERVQNFVDDLLVDRRGGRKGLSERVRSELQQLARYHALRPAFRRDAAPAQGKPRWFPGRTG